MTRNERGKLNFFYGPVTEAEAKEIAEDLCDSRSFFLDLVAFLQHDLAPGELEYRVQVLAEGIEEFRRRKAMSS